MISREKRVARERLHARARLIHATVKRADVVPSDGVLDSVESHTAVLSPVLHRIGVTDPSLSADARRRSVAPELLPWADYKRKL